MNTYDIKFLNEGRLSKDAMRRIEGGLALEGGPGPCKLEGGSYFTTCLTLYGTCKDYGLCWGPNAGEKLSCTNFGGKVPCEPYTGKGCSWDSGNHLFVEAI